MSKHSLPRQRRLRLRGVLLTLGVLSAGIAGTAAVFSDTATSQINVSAGIVSLSVDEKGGTDIADTYVLDLDGMHPGSDIFKVITLHNTGSLPITVGLREPVHPADGLADRINATVYDNEGTVWVDETLTSIFFYPDPSPYGINIPPGGSKDVYFEFFWMSSPDDNAWQGKSDVVNLVFYAENR